SPGLNINPLLCGRFRKRLLQHFHVTSPVVTFDLRKVELTPLEQRKLTFDSHTMVTELESSGFERRQAELIVSALVTLATANMDIVYKDMVTKSHQEIAVQQIMAHLDSIRKDMVILEKSEFANLRSENSVPVNIYISVFPLLISEGDVSIVCVCFCQFTEQEKKLMEATSEFHHKINKKIDLQVASLKTVLESLKLETVRYLAG
uniref:Coiled-coil domain containing 90B n=1 Tax=Seriola lalandi dorsalis TaxID=1841481 RepID=A0A3B4WFY7_SERLL